MLLVGRKKEQMLLSDCLSSPRPEFLAVYGRRRVGKTYLIRQYFNDRFSFYATGEFSEKMRNQLKLFHEQLRKYGWSSGTVPKDWLEAFSRLRDLLEQPDVYRDPSGKRIVFLDEVPWMDTARSDFRSALDYFWNSWGSAQPDLILIVCGSATSWIIEHLLDSRGGFYNRITRQIHVKPFCLNECELLCSANGLALTRPQILEVYMILGGIPYYLNLLNPRFSLPQNIQEMCFQDTSPLRYEYPRLFNSLFRNPEKHLAVIQAAASRRSGITRKELAQLPAIGNGENLTKTLSELEQCGFLRKYRSSAAEKNGLLYQIIDPFVLFSLHFLQNNQIHSWTSFNGTPAYYAWKGNAFETLCLNHVEQIKTALEIRGVETEEYAWRSRASSPGVQIDLLIDRRDNVINLCEMKCTDQPFIIDASYERQMLEKLAVFRAESKTKKAVHLTMISASGLFHNAHAGIILNEITGDDLFSSC